MVDVRVFSFGVLRFFFPLFPPLRLGGRFFLKRGAGGDAVSCEGGDDGDLVVVMMMMMMIYFRVDGYLSDHRSLVIVVWP